MSSSLDQFNVVQERSQGGNGRIREQTISGGLIFLLANVSVKSFQSHSCLVNRTPDKAHVICQNMKVIDDYDKKNKNKNMTKSCKKLV